MINREQVYKKFGGHCAYCGKEIKFKEMQVDHIKAKANNKPIGRDLMGDFVYPDIDDIINLMPSCRRCNHYKRAGSLDNFRILLLTLHERMHNLSIAKVAEDYGIIEYKEWDGKFYFEKIKYIR
jgi:5-methylcytosine-specific restriction endonuclease McrA